MIQRIKVFLSCGRFRNNKSMQKLILSLFVLAFLIACNSGEKRGPISNYKYKVYTDTKGSTPNIGDYVYFEMDIMDDSSKVLQTYEGENAPSLQIVGRDNDARRTNPILDILAEISLGDEVGIIVPRDSVPNMPAGFEYIKYLEYRVRVKEIVPSDQFQARMDEERKALMIEMERLQTRMPEIESLAATTLKNYKAGKLVTEVSPRAVKYYIHEKGQGAVPGFGEKVTVHYYGLLANDASMFDNSYSKGMPFSFAVGTGEVIPGWDEMMAILPAGTKASLFIPGEMGYGTGGFPPEIPGNAELYFYIEIQE